MWEDTRRKAVKKILTVNLPDDKKKAVRDICAAMGADMTELLPWQYGYSVGELISGRLDGVSRDETCRSLNLDMIIFSGFGSREIDDFLAGYKAFGIEPVKLKSVVTDTNRSWTVEKLYSELGREYLFYKMRGM